MSRDSQEMPPTPGKVWNAEAGKLFGSGSGAHGVERRKSNHGAGVRKVQEMRGKQGDAQAQILGVPSEQGHRFR